MNQVPEGTIINHIRKESESQKHLTRLTKERQSDREHKTSVRQGETYNQTTYRREYNRQCNKTSRAQETPEKTKQLQHIDKTNTSQTRLAKKSKVVTIDEAMSNFRKECKKQPVYICTSCHRLFMEERCPEVLHR